MHWSLPDSYYGRIREICDEFGVLLIYDEVMSGAGRTGRYLAAEHWNIKPDIIALAKGLAAGYAPLGAMIADDPIIEQVLDAGGFQHGYTYAGNPLACAAGLAVTRELLDHDLMGRAHLHGRAAQTRTRGPDGRLPLSSATSAGKACCWPSNWSPTGPPCSPCRPL